MRIAKRYKVLEYIYLIVGFIWVSLTASIFYWSITIPKDDIDRIYLIIAGIVAFFTAMHYFGSCQFFSNAYEIQKIKERQKK